MELAGSELDQATTVSGPLVFKDLNYDA